MILAVMRLVRETSPFNTVWCEVYQPVVDWCRQVESSQLGQQRGVLDGVKCLGTIQADDNDKWVGLQQVGNGVE